MSGPTKLVLSASGQEVLKRATAAQKGHADAARWTRLIDGLIASPWPGVLPLEEKDPAFLLEMLEKAPADLFRPDQELLRLIHAHLRRGLYRPPAPTVEELNYHESRLTLKRLSPGSKVRGDTFKDMVRMLARFTKHNYPHFSFVPPGKEELGHSEHLLLGLNRSEEANLIPDLTQKLQSLNRFPQFTIT